MKKITKLVAIILALLITASCSTAAKGEESIVLAPAGEPLIGNLKISAYDTMLYGEFLKEAAKLFMEKHPDTNIEVETFSAMPEMKTQENDDGSVMAISSYADNPDGRKDYLSRINTQLMSGEGADIYAVDVIPLESYVKNGQAENLSPYIEQDTAFKKDDVQGNILEAAKINEQNYYLPLTYDFSYIAYNKEVVSDSEKAFLDNNGASLQNIIENKGAIPTEEDAKLMNWSKNQLAYTLIEDAYSDFIDQNSNTASFTNENFVKLLEEVAALEVDGYLSPDKFSQLETAEERMEFFEQIEGEAYKYAQQNSIDLIQKYNQSQNFRVSMTASGGNSEDYVFGAMKGNAAGEIVGSAPKSLMLNSQSKNKALAWEFMKFLLSEEMQSSPSLSFMGMPMNNAARTAYYKMFLTGGIFGEPIEVTPEIEASVAKISAEVEKYSSLITTIPQYNPTVKDIIDEGLGEYFDGKKTAQETAEYLQNKITLYLNE